MSDGRRRRAARPGPASVAGAILAAIAVFLMVATDVHAAAPIALFICGFTFIGRRRR